MNVVNVRNLTIGEGMPKICVPIVGKNKDEIVQSAEKIKNSICDLVEWRADWFEAVFELDQVKEVLTGLRESLEKIPILFTFRTTREGGAQEISAEYYKRLNLMVAGSGLVDLVDVEMFWGDLSVKTFLEELHKTDVKIIGSNHDFEKTPEKKEIVERLRFMQEANADIPKIAVMPQNKCDVLTLLAATEEMERVYADRPIITMSMAGAGMISRVSGEIFGSSVTFGTVGASSAPGQLEVEKLRDILEIIHQNG